MNDTIVPQQTTLGQWLAQCLRQLAERLDGDTLAPPTPLQLARAELREAEVALMQAEAEAERYSHSVKMLSARIARLRTRAG